MPPTLLTSIVTPTRIPSSSTTLWIPLYGTYGTGYSSYAANETLMGRLSNYSYSYTSGTYSYSYTQPGVDNPSKSLTQITDGTSDTILIAEKWSSCSGSNVVNGQTIYTYYYGYYYYGSTPPPPPTVRQRTTTTTAPPSSRAWGIENQANPKHCDGGKVQVNENGSFQVRPLRR